MSNVDLNLTANNQEYISAIQGAIQANQRLRDTTKQAAEEEKRNIRDIKMAIEEYRLKKEMASSTQAQEAYNKKIQEAKLHLHDANKNLEKYNNQLKQQEVAVNRADAAKKKLLTTLGRLAGAVGGVYGAFRILQGVISATDSAADRLQATKAGLKGAMDALNQSINQGDWSGLIENMRNAYQAARDYEYGQIELGHVERAYSIQSIELMNELNEVRNRMNEQETRTIQQRMEDLEEFNNINNKLLENEQFLASETIRLEQEKLQKRLNLSEEQLALMDSYVRNYNTLTNNELADVRRVTEARDNQKKIERQVLATRIALGVNLSESLRKEGDVQIQKAKEVADAEENSLNERARAYFDLSKQIDLFEGEEADRMGEAMKRVEQATARKITTDRVYERFRQRFLREEQAERDAARAIEEQRIKEFNALRLKLEEMFNAQKMEGLTGYSRIDQERVMAQASIDVLKDELESKGTLEREHLEIIHSLRAEVDRQAQVKRNELRNASRAEQNQQYIEELQLNQEQNDRLRELKEQVYLSELDMLEDSELKKLEFKRDAMEREIATLRLRNEEVSNLEAELLENQMELINRQIVEVSRGNKANWKDYVSAVRMASMEVVSLFRSVHSERVAIAERERSLLDTRVAEAERAVNREIQINAQGNASNIALEKERLAAVKAEREEALRVEEEMLAKQRALDSIMQANSLISASANIYKSLSGFGPIGIALAITTITTMLAMFAKSKLEIRNATKLRKGASGDATGMVTGRTHEDGGEKFLDHIEVERGEQWGVLSASKVPKYSAEFHRIVKEMNEGKYKPLSLTSNIHNRTERGSYGRDELLSINAGISKLNRTMADKEQVTELADRIIIRSGNKTRIIRR